MFASTDGAYKVRQGAVNGGGLCLIDHNVINLVELICVK